MSDSPANILVVDDDEFTGELTGLILESAGYDTVISSGGMDALEKLANDPAIRVVVSDMNMPVMDGIKLFAEMRKQGFSQPFVLLTGEEAAPLRIAHPDMEAVLTKDEQLQEALPEVVESLIARP
ncbi:transcriptional regulatory protein QseF [Geobacter sp. OR-1]|uniref:response regulator n=1 Tax=Geobacter sp. OR-1 TaxID=1266765 RepID=UPI000543663E|nr:response regulator [Geobacter sp. OR-1]GAM09094.1 transcriptional regulatory protein QseF [Geobacter sp. OR-1]